MISTITPVIVVIILLIIVTTALVMIAAIIASQVGYGGLVQGSGYCM